MHKPHGPIDTSKGYETSDLPIAGVVKGTIIFFVFTTVAVVLAYVYLASPLVPNGIGVQGSATRAGVPPPPNPLLQNNITATVDLWKMRAEERRKLNSVGWVNRQQGIARIPISEAIDQEVRAREGGR